MSNDENGRCTYCGRDNRGYENEPCSDDCPQYDALDAEFEELYADGEGDSYWTEWEEEEEDA